MRTKHFITMAALAGAIMMTSCNSEEIQPEVNDGAVKFTSNLTSITVENSPNTRVTDGEWDKNDQIGIFMIRLGSNFLSHGGMISDNIPYISKNGDGIFTSSNDNLAIHYPTAGDPVYFVAYYPYTNSPHSKTQVDVYIKKNQEEQEDFLWVKATNDTKGYTKQNDVVKLKFNHKLSKLVMNVRFDEGVSVNSADDIGVKIHKSRLANRFNLTTGEFDNSYYEGSTTGVTPRRLSKTPENFFVSYDAILMPKKGEREEYVEFKIGNEYFIWDIGNIEFKSGYKYVYDLTITTTDVLVRGEILDWATDDSVQGQQIIH